jgi:serine/threonine protein kinase
MLRADGSLALSDFGIAKHTHTELYETAHGEVFGTPVYIAPEQATGQAIDHRADIYSLGAMFFELLTGAPPYKARDAQTMLEQHVHAPLPKLPEHLEHFAPLIDNMLAKNPDERPASAQVVLVKLGRLFSAPNGSLTQAESVGIAAEISTTTLFERIHQAAGLSLALSSRDSKSHQPATLPTDVS